MELRNRNNLDRYGLLIITLGVFVGVFVLSSYVRFYGDDLFYSVFTKHGFGYYVKRHMEHYQLANGRVIVHLLATAFLGLDTIWWAICNGLMLAGIVYFGTKVAFDHETSRGLMLWGGILMASSLGMLNPHMTRESVYWITGSFNYVYPLTMLLTYWYFLNKTFARHQFRWYLPILGFLASATVEQGSLMAFGLTLLVYVDLTCMKKYKWNKWMTINLIVVTLGMLSVICAPSVILRMGLENKGKISMLEIMRKNLMEQGYRFFFTRYLAPFHVLALAGAWGAIIAGIRKRASIHWLSLLLCVMGGVANMVLFIHLYRVNTLYSPTTVSTTRGLLYIGVAIGYFLVLTYGGIQVYKHRLIKQHSLPLIALILGVGSQLMMLILPQGGPRNLIFVIVMLALYGASLIPHYNRWGTIGLVTIIISLILKLTWILPLAIAGLVLTLFLIRDDRNPYGRIGIVISYVSIVLIAAVMMFPTVRGYRNSARIYDDNMRLVRQYQVDGVDGLIQHKLVPDIYNWAMPYHNSYYDAYYKDYMGIERDTQIQWK